MDMNLNNNDVILIQLLTANQGLRNINTPAPKPNCS